MPTYKYTCKNSHDYSELRPVEQAQIFTSCQTCGEELTEVTE